jgi:hypothetical protein
LESSRLLPSRCGPWTLPTVNREIPRFPYKERLGMLGSSTSPDRSSARDSAVLCMAFRQMNGVGIRNGISWLNSPACRIPCQRFVMVLAEHHA